MTTNAGPTKVKCCRECRVVRTVKKCEIKKGRQTVKKWLCTDCASKLEPAAL